MPREQQVAQRDPYLLDSSRVQEPPTTWLGYLRYCGPGFILSASIVGSGELIATTTLGAEVGFVMLWLILLSCIVKVALQLEFGRHTIQTGETAMTALNRLPGPRLGRAHWTVWFWIVLQPLKVLQVGGVLGGQAILLNLVFPSISIPTWAWISAVTVALLVFVERYRFIERLSLALLFAFSVTSLMSVISLQWTQYAFDWAELWSGLQFHLPRDKQVLLVVFGAFGLTGVGGDEIMQYSYWLLEKGYATYVGPRRDDDPAWTDRARRWTRVMYFDALLSMVAYTVVTAAFYVLGAAVLHARGEVPRGYALIETLAKMYTESLGEWAQAVFLLGAFAVLFSTLFSALAAWTRIDSDALSKLGVLDFNNPVSRRRWIAGLAWFFPLAWAAVFLWVKQPVTMVMLGGLATAVILLMVVLAAVHFHRHRAVPGLEPGPLYNFAFWVSCVSITTLAGYGIYQALTATG